MTPQTILVFFQFVFFLHIYNAYMIHIDLYVSCILFQMVILFAHLTCIIYVWVCECIHRSISVCDGCLLAINKNKRQHKNEVELTRKSECEKNRRNSKKSVQGSTDEIIKCLIPL